MRRHFSHAISGSTWLHGHATVYDDYSSYTVNAFSFQAENGLENVFFLHFLLV